MFADIPALSAAAIFLILGAGTFWSATRPTSVGRRQVTLVFAWLCTALSATLVIFSLFPTATANGSVMGVTLGGAGAFTILVWTAAIRAGRSAERIDDLAAEVRELKTEISRLVTSQRPRRLEYRQIFCYEVARSVKVRKRVIGVVTGDIRLTRCAEVWVNPENTDMRMSRVQDHSISGLIRYEGSRRNETGHVMEDRVADELDRFVGSNRPVPAGTVIVTGSGELISSSVKWIAHVAAVHGEPGSGFSQVRQVDRCVVNVLRAVGSPGGQHAARTVLFPLLGSGHGGGDLRQTVQTLATVITSYLADTADTSLETVFLLAYTDAELRVCRDVLGSMSGLTLRAE